MKIGIIGSGQIGSTLARLFRRAGHAVAIANSRGPASLAELAHETGATAETVAGAVRDRDIVVVTIPLLRIVDLPPGLFASLPDRTIVIDTNNYYPQQRDGRIAAIEAGLPESQWVEQQLGHQVVKVFNSIRAVQLAAGGRPSGTPGRIALALSGDDAGAKAAVAALLDGIGYDAVDAGSISESWRQQPGSPNYLQDFDAARLRVALAQATPDRTPAWRATPNSPGTFDVPA